MVSDSLVLEKEARGERIETYVRRLISRFTPTSKGGGRIIGGEGTAPGLGQRRRLTKKGRSVS